MSTVLVVNVEPSHVDDLARTMRAGDRAECVAAGYPDARTALEVSVENSTHSWALTFDGEVAAILGVAAVDDGVALVWALTGNVVDRARLTFMRESRRLLSGLLWRYRGLFNVVDARYQGALDWLECLGFTVSPAQPHPTTGEPFCPVSIWARPKEA